MSNIELLSGLLIPFAGTAAGSLCVLFMKRTFNLSIQKALTGFAAGVMVAASIWSLIIPAIEQSSAMGRLSFLPAVIGFWVGILFLMMLDRLIPHLHVNESDPEGVKSHLTKTTMMVLAVVIHNIPEGMAVGVVFAGIRTGSQLITLSGAFALSLGIAIQNIPEGAIISMPLYAAGVNRPISFLYGVLSGAVEPAAGILTVLIASKLIPVMPYLLTFASGAMIYVVVEELIPEMTEGRHSHIGVLLFSIGFSLMMSLDIALG